MSKKFTNPIPNKLKLALAISLAVAAAPDRVHAQDDNECLELDGTPPGLYVTVDQNQVYLTKDGEVVELDPGEVGYANENQLACLKVPPRVMAWPCGSAEAMSRQMAPTFRFDEVSPVGLVQEVKRRYFEENQAIGPEIEWLNGTVHGTLHESEFEGLDADTYWYLPGGPDPFASPKRPRAQLVGLFWSTRQAVLDTNTLDVLSESQGPAQIPVVFMYHRDYEVPVSFFGADVSLSELLDAFLDRGVQLAPVPVWYAGDHHLKVAISEFEQHFDIPALDEINPAQLQRHMDELKASGFTHKPVLVSMLAESNNMMVDQPERIRAAAELGIREIPTVIFYYTSSTHLAGCGLPLPVTSVVGSVSDSGPAPVVLPPPERKASDS
jgi:hypothetical protein